VAQGLLSNRVSPVYPAVARAARVQGIVILQALIGKDGQVKELSVVSGPPLLQSAAIDAVKQWVYRPYLLNGDPVEVMTTVNVVFTLGEPPAKP
jgi:protein TonB